MDNRTLYADLMEAAEKLSQARRSHPSFSPPWRMLNRAEVYLEKQADVVMRGEEEAANA